MVAGVVRGEAAVSAAPAPTPEPTATPTDADVALAMGARLIRRTEGCTLAPQPDTPPHWQIGYGCNYLADGSPVTAATAPLPDIAAAEVLLMAHLIPLAEDVKRELTRPASVNQLAALYDFAWNLGVGALAGSTMLRLFNAGDPRWTDEFPKWVYAGGRMLPGLVKRRALERAVALGEITP